MISLNAAANPNGLRIGGAGPRSILDEDIKLCVRKEIDYLLIKGTKIGNLELANLIKIVAESHGFYKQIQIHLHETVLPNDASDEIYYLTQQVLSRFRSEWKVLKRSGSKSFVDIDDLLIQMIPSLVKVQLMQKLDQNATLSHLFFSFLCFVLFFFVLLFFVSSVRGLLLHFLGCFCLCCDKKRNICAIDQTMLWKGLFSTSAKQSFTTLLLSQLSGSHKTQGERQTSTLIPVTWFDLERKVIIHGSFVLIIPSKVQAIGRKYDQEKGISKNMNNKMQNLELKLQRGYNRKENGFVVGSSNGWNQDYNMATVVQAILKQKRKGAAMTDGWEYFEDFPSFVVFIFVFLIYFVLFCFLSSVQGLFVVFSF